MDQQQETVHEQQAAVSIPPPPPMIARPPVATSERPKAVTVIGILLLVLACLSLVGILISMKNFISVAAFRTIPHTKLYLTLGSYLLAIIFQGIIQGIMGLGLLKMATWARKWTIVLLIFLFVAGGVNSIFMLKSVFQPAYQDLMAKTLLRIGIREVVQFVLYIGSSYYLTRPAIVRAFKGAGE